MSTIIRVGAAWRRRIAATTLILSAWLALAVWSISPYAAWLDHARVADQDAALPVRLAVFMLGWTLMIIAMMLPGTLLLARSSDRRPLQARQIVPMILVYLAIWALYGGACYLGDRMLHALVDRAPALAGAIAPTAVLVAGAYQVTPLKRACLAHCGAPATSKPAHYEAGWILGLRQGLYCLGSCWALMLLMFAVGGLSLIWMLALGAAVSAERLSRYGADLAQALAALLLVWAIVLLF